LRVKKLGGKNKYLNFKFTLVFGPGPNPRLPEKQGLKKKYLDNYIEGCK
jgi:hypothetical protein